MSRRSLVVLLLSGALVLVSCGTASRSGDSSNPVPTTAAGSRSGTPTQIYLFTKNATFVVPPHGAYQVLAVGGGGGGGGGGSALDTDGVPTQVGGAGGASGAVTINSFLAPKGARYAVIVGKGGTPGSGGAANGGAGARGGGGGIS